MSGILILAIFLNVYFLSFFFQTFLFYILPHLFFASLVKFSVHASADCWYVFCALWLSDLAFPDILNTIIFHRNYAGSMVWAAWCGVDFLSSTINLAYPWKTLECIIKIMVNFDILCFFERYHVVHGISGVSNQTTIIQPVQLH